MHGSEAEPHAGVFACGDATAWGYLARPDSLTQPSLAVVRGHLLGSLLEEREQLLLREQAPPVWPPPPKGSAWAGSAKWLLIDTHAKGY